MNSVLRNSRHLWFVAFAAAGAAVASTLALLCLGSVWTQYDYRVLDLFYRQIVQRDQGPKQSPQVVYVIITDHTYDFFAKNILIVRTWPVSTTPCPNSGWRPWPMT